MRADLIRTAFATRSAQSQIADSPPGLRNWAILTILLALSIFSFFMQTKCMASPHIHLKSAIIGAKKIAPKHFSNKEWAIGHYGIMSHFLPYAATINDFNKIVDAFDVNAYADDIAQTGARYVIFTLGQQGFFCSPNRTLDTLCGPVTSRRDLIRDVSNALASRGIQTVAYIPSGAPEPMAAGTGYNEIDSGGPGRRLAFQENWQRVVAEYSQRWGRHVSGWWFDGMYDWQKMYAFTTAPSYQSLAGACRIGNPSCLIAFNDGNGAILKSFRVRGLGGG